MRTPASTVLILVLGFGCASDLQQEPDPDAPPSFRHAEFYESVQEWAEDLTRIDGDWREDWGDGAFFGLGFYAREGTSSSNDEYLAIAGELMARNLALIDEQNLLTGDINEIAMCLLGLLEYAAATGDTSGLPVIDEMIGVLNELVEVTGYYFPPEAVDSFAMDFYGPTSINGLLALISLQRAYLFDGDDGLVEVAARVVEQIEAHAWNGTYYTFSDTREGLYLYPNVTMILLNVRLFQLTADAAYLDRALATHQGIQPLRVDEASGLAGTGRYRSPYSAEIEGAETDDYSTLSSQNYLMMALMVLYEITEDAAYLLEVDAVLDFVEQHMVGQWCLSHFHTEGCTTPCDEGDVCIDESCWEDTCQIGVLHHWIDGRLAVPEDTVLICSGCNLQLLYVMWYRQNLSS